MGTYGSNQSLGATFTATGVSGGRRLGVVGNAVVASTNQFTITKAPGYAIDETVSDIAATVALDTVGSVTVESETDTTLVVRTWGSGGAAAALPFGLTGKRRAGGGKPGSQPPYGSLIASGKILMPAGVPTLTGRSNGVVSVAAFGTGLIDVTLAPNSVLSGAINNVVHISGADQTTGAAGLKVGWTVVDADTIRFSISVGGTPTNAPFAFAIERIGVGS